MMPNVMGIHKAHLPTAEIHGIHKIIVNITMSIEAIVIGKLQ